MNGREEKAIKIENNIIEKLKNQPPILSKYYNSIEQKTATTKNVYINYLIDYFSFLDNNHFDPFNIRTFSKIKKMNIDDYLAFTHYTYKKNGERKVNGESIRRGKIAAVKSFYDFLVDNNYIDSNPCDKVKLPKIVKDIEVITLTNEEVDLIKTRIQCNSKNVERDLAIFVLMLRTGLRVEAVIEINISDIDFNKNAITVTEKGNKKREIYFGDNTKNIIISWLNKRGNNYQTDALFINKNGERISYATPKYLIDKYANDFGKRITCHKTRSTYASNTYEETGDIYLVADSLGHSNISNTRRYAKISEKKRKMVASISDNY